MAESKRRSTRLEDIAREAGVSVSTVSRALHGGASVNNETRRRILELARSEAYDAPTRRARRPRDTDGHRVTVILAPPLARVGAAPIGSFALSILGGITAALLEREIDLTISHLVPRDDRSLGRFLQDNPQDGLIFLGQSPVHEGLNKLAASGRNFVVWGAAVPGQKYCSVGSDNFKGGQRATSHLLRLGRKRIGFLGHLGSLELQQRHDGYLAALQEAGIAEDPALFCPCPLTPEPAGEALDSLIDQGVALDALVCGSDLVGLGAMKALMRRGFSIPADVAIVGYDDIELAAHMHPALTTIRQDPVKAGRLLVTKLLGMMEGGQATSELLNTDLIVRETCGA